MARDNYADRKREEDRQRYELISQYIADGKSVSVADMRFYNFYRICVLPKGTK